MSKQKPAVHIAVGYIYTELAFCYLDIGYIVGASARSVRSWHLTHSQPRKVPMKKLYELWELTTKIVKALPDSETRMRWLYRPNTLLYDLKPITLIKGGSFGPINKLLD